MEKRDTLEQIREEIAACDASILEQLKKRMQLVEAVADYKKTNHLSILQPEQEQKKLAQFQKMLQGESGEKEILDVMEYIMKNSRKAQSKRLFDYNIFLVGFMGAGKSTIAGQLAALLEMQRVEMDQMIVEEQGMPISEIFEKYGEDYFRDIETQTLIALQKRKQTIVSCGGGVVVREENEGHMKKNGRVILLTARPETILERVKGSTERPILNNNMNVNFISELMEKRRERYLAVADYIVETDGKDVRSICEEIIARLLEMDEE